MWHVVLILLLLGWTAPVVAQHKGQMFGGAPTVFDGDTLLVTPEGAPSVHVRLWGIETSEMRDAPWGQQARTALADCLDWSRRVQCRVVDRDVHKLPIARCVTTGPGAAGGKDLAIWLLEPSGRPPGRSAPARRLCQCCRTSRRPGLGSAPGSRSCVRRE